VVAEKVAEPSLQCPFEAPVLSRLAHLAGMQHEQCCVTKVQ